MSKISRDKKAKKPGFRIQAKANFPWFNEYCVIGKVFPTEKEARVALVAAYIDCGGARGVQVARMLLEHKNLGEIERGLFPGSAIPVEIVKEGS